MSLESAWGIASTELTPYDLSTIERLQQGDYWTLKQKAHVKELDSLMKQIWSELKGLTKMRINNFFAQIEEARKDLRITVRELVDLLPSDIDLFELWLIDNESAEWTKPIAKDALDSALQLVRDVNINTSNGVWSRTTYAIRDDPRFDEENWASMIGNRQGRILRALIYLKNDFLDVKAYNKEYKRSLHLPPPLTPDDLLSISFEVEAPARQRNVPIRLHPDGITRRLVKLEKFKAKRYRPPRRTVAELQH
ncbi:hypothetical protein JCM3765_002076 [Sporobolomyces pararoseus]